MTDASSAEQRIKIDLTEEQKKAIKVATDGLDFSCLQVLVAKRPSPDGNVAKSILSDLCCW